jgi:hypothetical protein
VYLHQADAVIRAAMREHCMDQMADKVIDTAGQSKSNRKGFLYRAAH